MEKITIEEVLQKINEKIENLDSADLRAESIKKHLMVEFQNRNNIIQDALNINIPITDVMNNQNLLSDIIFAILVITRYELSKSFVVSIPDNNSKDVSTKQNIIASIIEKVVENKQF